MRHHAAVSIYLGIMPSESCIRVRDRVRVRPSVRVSPIAKARVWVRPDLVADARGVKGLSD